MDYIGFSKNTPVIRMTGKDKIIQAFDELFEAWVNQESYLLLCKFYNLISVLRANNESPIKSKVLQHDNLLLQRAENIIRMNIHRNLQVQELVKLLNIDRSYFSKIFKQYYKTSPHTYIMKLRLKNAETLLKTTDLSITEIVNMLNFTDTYSFAKQFKKMFDYSPTEYRKRISKNYF